MSLPLRLMRLGRLLLEPAYPLAAVEVRARTVGVVRLSRERGTLAFAAAACLDLPEGTLKLSMTEPNVLDPAAFQAALAGALERAGARDAGRVALVLPDPVARVSLHAASEVRGRSRGESEDVIRFRLRKVVPFDVREARVTAIAADPARTTTMVGAIFRPVLEGYEAACEALGLHAGLVELSGLALLASALRGTSAGDRLLVNWDEGYVSLLLVRNGTPILMRTLVGEAATPEQVVREVGNTVVYYRERLGGAGLAGAAVRSAAVPPAEAVLLLQEPLALVPEVVDPWGPLGVSAERLDAAQALAGAAACVVGRAA